MNFTSASWSPSHTSLVGTVWLERVELYFPSPLWKTSRLKLGISLSPSGKVRVGFVVYFPDGRLEWVLAVYFHPSGSVSLNKAWIKNRMLGLFQMGFSTFPM